MSLPPLSRDESRRVDAIAINEFGIPGVVLMENAGRGAAEEIHRIQPSGEIAILAGKGNNAGDGYVIARHLQLFGRSVRILSLVDPLSLNGDALINARIAIAAEIDIVVETDEASMSSFMTGAAVVVDCLLGTGAAGSLRPPFATAVQVANQADVLRIAIDVPTGMDCDSGQLSEPTFRADYTLTFVAKKKGFALDSSHLGEVRVVSIGIPRKLIDFLGG